MSDSRRKPPSPAGKERQRSQKGALKMWVIRNSNQLQICVKCIIIEVLNQRSSAGGLLRKRTPRVNLQHPRSLNSPISDRCTPAQVNSGRIPPLYLDHRQQHHPSSAATTHTTSTEQARNTRTMRGRESPRNICADHLRERDSSRFVVPRSQPEKRRSGTVYRERMVQCTDGKANDRSVEV